MIDEDSIDNLDRSYLAFRFYGIISVKKYAWGAPILQSGVGDHVLHQQITDETYLKYENCFKSVGEELKSKLI